MSTTDEEVLSAAKDLSEELATAQSESTSDQFESILAQCNEEISQELGIQYGDAAGTDDCC